MVERFFFTTQSELHRREPDPITLLSGPSSCGKTSLLFQFAFNSASGEANGDRKVVFICNRRRLEARPPFLSQGIDPSSDIFQRIKMKYVDDEEGIKKYFAAFHLHGSLPAAVVVDNFGDFFDERTCQERYNNPRGREMAIVRVLALCHNAIIHANEKGRCELLLSDMHQGDSPRLLFVYKRWIPTIFIIKGDGCADSGSYLLKHSNHSTNGNSMSTRTAKYSIGMQYLLLEAITEENERECQNSPPRSSQASSRNTLQQS